MGTVLWLALALAMLSTLWFVLRAGLRVQVLGGFAAVSRDLLWMSPLGHAALFVVAALPILVGTRLLSRAAGLVAAAGLPIALAFHAILLPWTQIGIYAAILLALGLGLASGRGLTRLGEARLSGIARRVTFALAALFALGSVVVAGTATLRTRRAFASLPAPAPDAPNVLLIVFDTFRTDELGTYGSTRGITPAVDAFAKGGTVFDWAVSTAGWTLPSHATMFTGRYPQRTNVDFDHGLGTRDATIAEAFRARGYETAGFAGNLQYVTWESGLDRGFMTWSDFPRSLEMVLKSTLHGQTNFMEEFLRAPAMRAKLRALRRKRLLVEPKPEPPPVDAREITDRFLAWQGQRDASRPYFAFLNYFDPHKPYLTPPKLPLADVSPDTLRAGYERDIGFLDEHVGRLLAALERRGALDSTLVVITADHGEHFGEHGLQGHSNSLYTALIHVPLIVRWDGHVPAGRRVSRTVSQRDLAQTLADVAGLRDVRFPGYSLAAAWRDSLTSASEAVAQHERATVRDFAEPAAELGMTAIVGDRWHMIRTMRRALEEMYDYRTDGSEGRNMVGADAAAAARATLVERLREALRADGADGPAHIGKPPR